MVSLFNKTIKNILSNYIPHERIICDDKDPPWFSKNNKQLIQEKNNTCKSYILSDKNPQIFERVKSLQNQSAKTYWSILKTLLNNKKFLASFLFHKGNYVRDFKKKAKLFNSFFSKQCSIIQNSSKLSLTLNNKKKSKIDVDSVKEFTKSNKLMLKIQQRFKKERLTGFNEEDCFKFS